MTSQTQSQEESTSPKIERLIDANINRLKEGLRVIEDICRYIFDNRELTSELKRLRHKLQTIHSINRLQYRDIVGDVQKESTKSELSRIDLRSVAIANFSRAEESSRVLEEIFKLQEIQYSELMKEIRYKLYDLERVYFINY